MDKKQLDEYKREMMKLYGKSGNAPKKEETPEENEPITEQPEELPDEVTADDDEAEIPDNTAEVLTSDSETPDDLDERYPDPDLSELGENEVPHENEIPTAPNEKLSIEDAEKSLGDSVGYILVNVRAGDDSFAVEGAAVVITAVTGGNRLLIASGTADSSGATQRFKVPVPDPSLSQSPSPETRPYSLYDISVTAKGFFNARSVDVPVFSGITSIQDFSMIPVPIMMNESDETLTIYNQEPFFGEDNDIAAEV